MEPEVVILGTGRLHPQAVLEYIKKHGREFRYNPASSPAPVAAVDRGRCFENATRLASRHRDEGWRFAEGFVTSPSAYRGVGILHAWAVTPAGDAIDGVLAIPDARYFGVVYEWPDYMAHMARTGTYGVLGGSDESAAAALNADGITTTRKRAGDGDERSVKQREVVPVNRFPVVDQTLGAASPANIRLNVLMSMDVVDAMRMMTDAPSKLIRRDLLESRLFWKALFDKFWHAHGLQPMSEYISLLARRGHQFFATGDALLASTDEKLDPLARRSADPTPDYRRMFRFYINQLDYMIVAPPPDNDVLDFVSTQHSLAVVAFSTVRRHLQLYNIEKLWRPKGPWPESIHIVHVYDVDADHVRADLYVIDTRRVILLRGHPIFPYHSSDLSHSSFQAISKLRRLLVNTTLTMYFNHSTTKLSDSLSFRGPIQFVPDHTTLQLVELNSGANGRVYPEVYTLYAEQNHVRVNTGFADSLPQSYYGSRRLNFGSFSESSYGGTSVDIFAASDEKWHEDYRIVIYHITYGQRELNAVRLVVDYYELDSGQYATTWHHDFRRDLDPEATTIHLFVPFRKGVPILEWTYVECSLAGQSFMGLREIFFEKSFISALPQMPPIGVSLSFIPPAEFRHEPPPTCYVPVLQSITKLRLELPDHMAIRPYVRIKQGETRIGNELTSPPIRCANCAAPNAPFAAEHEHRIAAFCSQQCSEDFWEL